MPITDQFERLPLSAITVQRDQRQRREIDTSDLDDSIRQHGVLVPLIVRRAEDGSIILVAGERRYASSTGLGLTDVPVRWLESLDPVECQIIELEENIKRKDLPWQDLVRATEKIHQLYMLRSPDWTMTETSQAIGLNLSTVSIYLRVGQEMDQPRIAEAGKVREAYNIIARKDSRAAGNALEELAGVPVLPTAAPPPPAPVDPILCQSFLTWAPVYSGQKFNLIHCDFPYGKNEFAGPQGQGAEPEPIYESDLGTYLALVECLCRNLDRLISSSGHLMFWCSGEVLMARSEYARATWDLFQQLAPGLQWSKFPLIWHKSDNAGIASDPRHWPRHVYETCLLASVGQRQIVQVMADCYSSPTDKRLHPSTKPEPMVRHFMQMLVDSTSRVLDPTAGSGAALRAADSLGAASVLGLELDPEHARVANQAFRQARSMRLASKQVA